ncbi:MAG: 50S ribosomal protein L24 [Oscillospiraceae bacterium]|jgi:large subunit ribosomal protein L24|nr:50S ribosomal protein L24 [Oscillospiraceae bacterium]
MLTGNLTKKLKKGRIHVKNGDSVVALCGKDRGKRGKVLAVSPREGKVIVSGVNIVSKHVKPRRAGEEGGILRAESALYSCKVQLVCSHCDRAVRVAHKFDENGKKQRICKKCGNVV